MTGLRRDETICATATGHGGAIAVIRMSGSDSLEICSRIFFPSDREIRLTEQKGYTLIHGFVRDEDEDIDDVLVSVFRAPRSYTGEDAVVISCHASPYIRKRILELLIKNGASPAEPGEFTRRAFMNGKMDLSQAEAVADVIAASNRSAHRVAMNQMRGGFSTEIGRLRKELLDFASLIELELDFGEEDVEFADRSILKTTILSVRDIADNLARSFLLGNAIRNGIPVAIVGKPNSGKSTLLNALLSEEKAIVSDIPGTTRDSIEDTINIEGIEYRFTDTAGLRDTSDTIEKIGIRKTHEKIAGASVILLIDDILETADAINTRAGEIRTMTNDPGKRLFIIINKTDLARNGDLERLKSQVRLEKTDILLFISARENKGLDRLRNELAALVKKEELNHGDVIISGLRHYDSLMKVSESLSRVYSGLEDNIPDDLIAIDIRHAIHYLGEITGEITSDEVLGNIFRNFCIGK